jgi:hypothetical protein
MLGACVVSVHLLFFIFLKCWDFFKSIFLRWLCKLFGKVWLYAVGLCIFDKCGAFTSAIKIKNKQREYLLANSVGVLMNPF